MRVDLEQRVEHDPRRATDDRLEQGHGHELEDGRRVHVHVHLVRVRVRVTVTVRVRVRVRVRHCRVRVVGFGLWGSVCRVRAGVAVGVMVRTMFQFRSRLWPIGLE